MPLDHFDHEWATPPKQSLLEQVELKRTGDSGSCGARAGIWQRIVEERKKRRQPFEECP